MGMCEEAELIRGRESTGPGCGNVKRDLLAKTEKATYPVKLTVSCDDRAGLLKQLTAVISDDNTNIRHMDVRTDDHRADIDVTIDIEDVKHLERIISGIRKIPGILDVQRVKKI